MTTSWTTNDIVALERAIARGMRSVTYASGTVTYHSLDEMVRLLDRMRAEVAGASSGNQAIYAGRVQ